MSRRSGLYVLIGVVLVMALLLAGCGGAATTTTTAATTTATAASADASWQTVESAGQLVVGLCAEYAPFESRPADGGTPVGFDVDLANALGQKLGVSVKIVDAAWEGLIGGILKGDYDVLITAMSKEEASAGRVNTSDPYYDLPEVIVVKAGETSIKTVADLAGKVVGVQSGTSAEKAVDTLTGLKEIKRYNYNPDAFVDLRAGRTAAVVVGEAYAATEAKNQTGIEVVEVQVASNPLVLVSKAGGDSLTQKLNWALAQVKGDGTYDQLVKKWLALG